MADLVVIVDASNSNVIQVDFNDSASAAGFTTGWFSKSDIKQVMLSSGSDFVVVITDVGHGPVQEWKVQYDGGTYGDALTVDSVAGVATNSSNADLAARIADLMV